MKRTLYQILGVDPAADAEQIAAAYAERLAALQAGAHDRNDLVLLREAFDVLSNPDRRSRYDSGLVAPPLTRRSEPSAEAEPFRIDWRYAAAIGAAAVGLALWWRSPPPPAPVVQQAAMQAAGPQVAAPAQEQASAGNGGSADAPARSGQRLSDEELFAMLAPRVARINVFDGMRRGVATGSGVAIGSDVIITNCHVALAGQTVQVKLGRDTYNASVAVADQEYDLCRLRVEGLNATPVVIGSSGALRTGQKVVAIGAPQGLDLTFSDGIVSSLRRVEGGTLIQTTAPISPGSSGGGLFDANGHLVGIVTFQMRAGQNLNFATPAEWISDMRARAGGGPAQRLVAAERESGSAGGAGDERPGAAAARMVVGNWHCHDVIGGRSARISFFENNTLNLTVQEKVVGGLWTLQDKKLNIRFANYNNALTVEHLSEDKIILLFRVGDRSVCARQ